MSILLKLKNCFKVKETQVWVPVLPRVCKFHQANCLSFAVPICNDNHNRSASFQTRLLEFIEILCMPSTLQLITVVNTKTKGGGG